jgi:hypothetical protein
VFESLLSFLLRPLLANARAGHADVLGRRQDDLWPFAQAQQSRGLEHRRHVKFHDLGDLAVQRPLVGAECQIGRDIVDRQIVLFPEASQSPLLVRGESQGRIAA